MPAPSFRDLDVYCFALLALAGASVLLFFRHRGWHPAGATVAAFATAFGGSAIWRIQHLKQIETFAFFMLTLWLLSRALERRTVFSGFLAGLAACAMVIEPGQVAMLGCYVLAGYVIYYWLSGPRFWTSVRQTLPALLSAGLTATVLAAVPILFSFLFIMDSNRAEIPFKEAARGSLHPASLLTAIVPNLYSVMGSTPYWGPGSIEWPASFLSMSENMSEVYIGALPVLLLLLFAFMGKRLWAREIRFFTLATLGLLTYALGRYTGAFALFYKYVPGVDLFRRPADATYALGAMAAIASGYALHLLLSGKEKLEGLKAYAVPATVAALIATGAGVAAAHGHLGLAWQSLAVSAGLFAAGWVLLTSLSGNGETYSLAGIALLAGFMTVDLSIGNGPNRSTGQPPSHYDEMRTETTNDTVAFLKAHLNQPPNPARRDRVELVGLGFEWPNLSMIHDFDHVMGYNPVRLGSVTEGLGASETVAETWERRFTPLYPSYRSLMADMLGLRYIAVKRPIETLDKKLRPGDLKLVTRTSDAYIYENPRALPRVIFTSDWLPADFAKLIADGRWPNFDPMRTVLLDQAPPDHAEMARPSDSRPDAKIALAAYENTEVSVEVDSQKPGFVILNDVWHPWWFATVDGKPAEILRANVLFRAVQVPPGRHTVRFEFHPVQGAMNQIAARLAGKKEPRERPPVPGGDHHFKPEASAQAGWRVAGIASGTLR